MQPIRIASVFCVLLILSLLPACHTGEGREKPDVSAIKLNIHLERFDRDLLEFKTKPFAEQAEIMHRKYGPFFNFYISHFVIGPRPAGDTTNVDEAAIKKYLADPYIGALQDSINLYFSNSTDVENSLTESFKYLKYYFPELTTPKVVGINSGLALGAFTYDKDLLGIGLDLYLGGNNIIYDSAGIFQYLRHKMDRPNIARNSMEVVYNLYFDEGESRGKTLIDAMAERGKKMYFLSYVLPDAPDSMILGYTASQTKWCKENEYEIWKFLNDKDLLYKENFMDQKRYLDEGPTTAGMPAEAPGNIGNWIGLQIAKKFMKETGGKISLHDMITKYDAKAILNKARYRPAHSAF